MSRSMKGLREFEQRLLKVVDRRTINQHVADHHGAEIVRAITISAHSGIGPNNAPYPAYSPEYGRQKQKKQGHATGNWLRGVTTAGRSGGMLGEERFKWEVDANGTLWIVWTPVDGQMGVYGRVHQDGLPMGRGGPSSTRKWLHFETARTAKAVIKAYQLSFDELVAQCNAGTL